MAPEKLIPFLALVLLTGADTPPKSNHYKVATIYHEPFVMRENENGGFKGLLIDFMDEIAGKLNFTVEYYLTPDGKFGTEVDKKWTGNIGEVLYGKADVALATTTIFSNRMKVIKFSLPFMTTGLSAVGRTIDFPVNLANLPKIVQMVEQGNISVGVLEGGAAHRFFNSTTTPSYQKIFASMNTDQSNFVKNYEEGIKKVRESSGKPFVFFGEKIMLNYDTLKPPCDIKPLSCETLNVFHLGLVYKQTIPDDCYEKVNQLIADMLQSGRIQMLKEKWFKNECK